MFSTPTSWPTPSAASGDKGLGGGSPVFPSPTKLQNNGLDGEELGTEMAAANLMKLSKQRGVSFSGKRAEVVTFKYMLENKLCTAFGDVAERLLGMNGANGYTGEEWGNLKEWQRAYIKGMDLGMRDYLLTSITQDEPTGQTLIHEIISADRMGQLGSSVGDLMRYIMSAPMNMTHSEAKVELLEINNMKINLNDSPEEMRMMCADVRTKWLAIPEKYRGPEEGLNDALIGLVPGVCEKYKETLKIQLDTRREMNDTMPTYEQLTRTVIAGIVRFRYDHDNTDQRMTLIAGDGGENNKCYNCGGKHKSWDCPKKCTVCATNYCGAPTGEPDMCPCAKKEMPPNSEVKNFLGKAIPDKLYAKLEAIHAKLHSGGGATDATLVTTATTDVWGGLVGNTNDLSLMVLPGNNNYIKCMQCEENGDPEGVTIQDYLKCGGAWSQCEHKCMCKTVSQYGLSECESCNNKFCEVHVNSNKHNCEAMKLQAENNFVAGCTDNSAFDDNNDYMADKPLPKKPVSSLFNMTQEQFDETYDSLPKRIGDNATEQIHDMLMESGPPLLVGDDYLGAAFDSTVCLVGTGEAIKGVPTTLVALDSCSHHHLTPSRMLCEVLGKIEKPSVMRLGGVNADNPAEVKGAVHNAKIYLPTENGGVAQAVLDELLYVPNAPCTILGQTKMWNDNGWRVRAEDTMRVELPGGERLRMWKQQKLPMVQIYASGRDNENANYSSLITTGDKKKAALLWHSRLVLDTRSLKALPEVSVGMQVKEFSDEVVKVIEVCNVRKLGGMVRKPYSDTPGAHRSAEVGGRVMLDVWGSYNTPAAGTKCKFIIGACDEFSGYGMAELYQQHTTEDIISFLEEKQLEYKAAGHSNGIVILRHDNAPEMVNEAWKNGLARLEMVDEHTIDYEKEGNGKAERSWGMMQPRARSMLVRCGGSAALFLHAMIYARQVCNELAQRGSKQSRTHLFHGKPGDVSRYRVFGAIGWCRLDHVVRGDKGQPTSMKCIMIGIEKIGWKVIVGEGATSRIKVVTQAEFYEENLITKGVVSDKVKLDATTQTDNGNVYLPVATGNPLPMPNQAIAAPAAAPTVAQARPRRPGHDRLYTTFTILAEADMLKIMETRHPNDPAHKGMVQNLSTNAWEKDEGAMYTLVTAKARGQARGEVITLQGPQGEYTRICPKNTTEAAKTPEAATWHALDVAHINDLESNETVIECHRSEAEGKTIHRTKIAYRIKVNPDDGTWDKDKVRGCVDTSQTWDSNEPVYADTINHQEMCLIIATAAKHGYKILKIDIKDAHPNTDLPNVHYATMFKGHARYQDDGTESIYKVKKGLPGLPPAARAFSYKLTEKLNNVGLHKCASSRAMYRMPGPNAHEGTCVIGGTLVDDCLFTGPTELLEQMRLAISKEFGGEITFGYEPADFGGYQLRRNLDTKSITVAVPEKVFQFATLMGVKHNPLQIKKMGPPAISKEEIDEIDFDRTNVKLDEAQKLCQKATGLLTWISQTRLDIVYHARKCSRVMSAPKATAVLKMLKAIAQALIESPHMGKTFSYAPGTTELEVVKYKQDRIFNPEKEHPANFEMVHDATFAVETNKSVGSAAYMYMGAALAVDIINIPGTPLSSTEAEKYMESVAMARGLGYSNLMTEIGMPQPKPIRMWGDNRISVELAHDARSGKNSTHFARRINYTQEMCKGDKDSPPEYLPAHIPTEKNTVDYLGKLVNVTKYRMSVAYNMGTAMEVPPTEDNKKRAMAAYQAANASD